MSDIDKRSFVMHADLAVALRAVADAEVAGDYDDRNEWVIEALSLAQALGMPVGFRIDPAEPEWPVAFIELPTGQVSWHLPQHIRAWDSHTTEEKYERIDEYAEGLAGP